MAKFVSKPNYCLHCGQLITIKVYGPVCSTECLDAHYLNSPHAEKIKCAGCGKAIVALASRKYCTSECRDKHSVKRIPIASGQRKRILDRDGGVCRYCGDPAEHLDHVLPWSKGGSNSDGNLVASCMACNYFVRDRVFSSFEEKKAFILKERGVTEKPFERKIEERKEDVYTRPAWHGWVYGGLKMPIKVVRK